MTSLQRSDAKLTETESIRKYALPNNIRVPIIRKIIETARRESIRTQADIIWQETKVEKKSPEFSVADAAFFLQADEPTMLKSLQMKLKSCKKVPLVFNFTTTKVRRKNVFKFFRYGRNPMQSFPTLFVLFFRLLFQI